VGGAAATDEEAAGAINTECSICLDDYKAGELVAQLPCGHLLHKACFVEWARTKLDDTKCPLCKAPIPVAEAQSDGCCAVLLAPNGLVLL